MMKNENYINELKIIAEERFFAVEDYSTELTGFAGEWEVVEKTEKGAKLLREYREAQKACDDAMDEYFRDCCASNEDDELEPF